MISEATLASIEKLIHSLRWSPSEDIADAYVGRGHGVEIAIGPAPDEATGFVLVVVSDRHNVSDVIPASAVAMRLYDAARAASHLAGVGAPS